MSAYDRELCMKLVAETRERLALNLLAGVYADKLHSLVGQLEAAVREVDLLKEELASGGYLLGWSDQFGA